MIVGGHSMAEQHSYGISKTFANGFATVGSAVWACAFSGHALQLTYNAGVAGNTTAQYLARQQADVLSQVGDFVYNLIGINDFSASVPMATIKANLVAIWKAQLGAGKIPIQGLLTAVDTVAVPSYASSLAGVPELNAWICQYAAANPWLIVVDLYSATIDPTGATYKMPAANTTDGLHMSAIGAQLQGMALWNAVKPYVRPRVGLVSSNADSNLVDSSSLQYAPNPMFTGTTGGLNPGAGTITGTVPDNWTFGIFAGTNAVTLTTVASPNGVGNGLRVQTSGAGSCQLSLYFTNALAAPATGSQWIAEMGMKVTSLTAPSEINSVIAKTTNGTGAEVGSSVSNSIPFPATISNGGLITLSTPIVTIEPGTITGFRMFNNLSFNAGGACDLILYAPSFRKIVPL